jgi:hypothetical protein
MHSRCSFHLVGEKTRPRESKAANVAMKASTFAPVDKLEGASFDNANETCATKEKKERLL